MIEMLIVVAIVGILAAIAVPAMINALDQARQTSSVARIRVLAGYVEQYIHATPEIGSPKFDDIFALNAKLREMGISTNDDILYDGWDNELIYIAEAGNAARGYTIISYGEDRAEGPAPSTLGEINFFDEDIVWINGQFAQRPKGVQKRR